MIGFPFLRRRATRKAAYALYVGIVEQARQVGFYTGCGVPDTVDGRFDMIALHAFLVMRRLKAEDDAGQDLSQALFDLMFVDMDQNLREMGVGDLAVGNRVKDMAKAYYGRVAAYDRGLAGGNESLAKALRRNVFRNSDPETHIVDELCAYIRDEAASLDATGFDTLSAGSITFGPPPQAPGKA